MGEMGEKEWALLEAQLKREAEERFTILTTVPVPTGGRNRKQEAPSLAVVDAGVFECVHECEFLVGTGPAPACA